ncbi:NYN domain-containing protein, partial [Mesorhizobium sp. M8A.F.Ca.ET.167.01.1.1]|uniref:NYN domain-containing protein n=1 Tax=Mesorhizobium sp. M8A.F.Ca.ET.167.01.1.1 TaxID=2563961 RepID=UPI00109383D8
MLRRPSTSSEEIARIGEVRVGRIYGDFSSQRLKSWADILSKHQNSSDIALVIDAIDLLHSGR